MTEKRKRKKELKKDVSFPPRMVERLLLYSKFLKNLNGSGETNVFSRDLADFVGVSPEQVRRDLMFLDLQGIPSKGYPAGKFLETINRKLALPDATKAVIVGTGRIGKAMLGYFRNGRKNITVVAAFNVNPDFKDTNIANCPVYDFSEIGKIIPRFQADIGIITVPAKEAQRTADALVSAGIKGLVNFAPVLLKVRSGVFIEQLDITLSIKKAAYFARKAAN